MWSAVSAERSLRNRRLGRRHAVYNACNESASSAACRPRRALRSQGMPRDDGAARGSSPSIRNCTRCTECRGFPLLLLRYGQRASLVERRGSNYGRRTFVHVRRPRFGGRVLACVSCSVCSPCDTGGGPLTSVCARTLCS